MVFTFKWKIIVFSAKIYGKLILCDLLFFSQHSLTHVHKQSHQETLKLKYWPRKNGALHTKLDDAMTVGKHNHRACWIILRKKASRRVASVQIYHTESNINWLIIIIDEFKMKRKITTSFFSLFIVIRNAERIEKISYIVKKYLFSSSQLFSPLTFTRKLHSRSNEILSSFLFSRCISTPFAK